MIHKDINAQEFKKLLEDETFVLLDVRTPQEYNSGRFKGASNIDFHHENFEDDLDKLDRNKKYLLYCRSGNRSKKAMFLMRDLGFIEVYNLESGIVSCDDHSFIEK